MTFTLIRPESRPRIDAVGTDEAAVAEADRVAVQLRRDYERWSRWAWGIAAFLVTVLGTFVAGGMVAAIAALGGPPAAVDIVVLAIAVLAAVGGGSALVRLWLTGRALTKAAAAWLRVPYRHGGRARRGGGWLLARTTNFDPPIFARLVTATLALLLAIAGVALAARDLAGDQFGAMSAAAAAVGVVSLACGLGQAGGVVRIVSGVSEGDPLWSRIRSVFRR